MPAFAFLTLPATGHLNPTLAIVEELVGRGAVVFYFCPEDMRARVEDRGAFWLDRPRRARMTGSVSPELGDDAVRRLPLLMAASAPVTVPPLVERIEEHRPDILVCNELDLTARLAARAVRRPAATFRPFHAAPRRRSPANPPSEELSRQAAIGLADWATRYGLPQPSLEEVLRGEEPLRFVFLPKRFQSMAELFDERYSFIGPSLVRQCPVPWPFRLRPGLRPRRAYISLGTLRNDRPEFYRLCFEAFAHADWEVVMSVGEQVERAELGAVPANFDVCAVVPQLAVLAQADVFVTHGGLNSVMEAMWTGVPVVVLPEIDEQRLTATRVVELGLGVALERVGLTREVLLAAAHRCATDADIGSMVGSMREEARGAGGASLAAQSLLRLAQETKT